MQTALRAGVTTVRDCGGRAPVTLSLPCAVREGLVCGPRVLACGAPVTTTGGHGWVFGGEADGIDGVRTAVRRQCRDGADFIKVMVTGGGSTPGTNFLLSQYSQEELDAIVQEAHRLGRKVAGHAHGTEGIRRAVKAGFDCIEHCSMIRESWTDAAYDSALGREMADRGVAVCRTMTGGEIAPLEELGEKHALWPQFEVLRCLVRDGVTIVTGTDAGIDGTRFDLAPRAVESLVGLAILSPREALATATSNAASALGLAAETGTLSPGRQADFIALAADPLQDIRALRDIRAVYRAGVEVPRAAARGTEARATEAPPGERTR
jgi:imidazolonepropionase-like amidohydrolase